MYLLLVRLCSFVIASAQTNVAPQDQPSTGGQSPAETLKLVDRLIEQNGHLEKQNAELIEEIKSLRQALAEQLEVPSQTPKPGVTKKTRTTTENVSGDVQEGQVQVGPNLSPTEESYKWGRYNPNLGFRVADTERGDLNISIYIYARYLNQLGLDANYTDAFGNVKRVQQRQDFLLRKVQIKFLGWMFDPNFRYFLYARTSNPSQDLPAQVVVAGNLNYTFKGWFSVGAGIRSPPGTASVEGNFLFWLGKNRRQG